MASGNPQTRDMLYLLKRLVEIESPSQDKAGVDKVGNLVSEECRRLGAEVIIHPNEERGNLVEARFFPALKSLPGKETHTKSHILMLCHMDTVFPIGTLTKMPYIEKDDKVFGPGVSDMKGGIVVTLMALKAALEMGSLVVPVTALFTPDEEIGSGSSKLLIEKLASESSLVLVLEPALVDGSLKTWRKGVGNYTIRVRGRSAHAGGDHEKGRNAIEELAHLVIAIQLLTDYDKGSTLNVGVIRGGIASNVVPDEASIDVDLRVLQPGEAERIHTAILGLKPVMAGTSIEVTGGLHSLPMVFDHTMKTTFEMIKEIARKENIELKAGGTGGGSDANFVAQLGIPVMDGLGPAGGEYHSEREFIFKDSLIERVRLLTAILRNR